MDIDNSSERISSSSQAMGVISTDEILKRLGIVRSDIGGKISLNRSLIRSDDFESYKLANGSMFFRDGRTCFVKTNPGHIFVIKSLDGRNVGIDEGVIDRFKENAKQNPGSGFSYVEIDGENVNITGGNDKYGVDELTKMFMECLRIGDEKSEDNTVKKVRNNRTKKVKNVKLRRIRGVKKAKNEEAKKSKKARCNIMELGCDDGELQDALGDLKSIETVKSKDEK